MRKFLGLLSIFALTAFGQLSSNESQYMRDVTAMTNPGLEQGLAGWTAAGTSTIARETTNKRTGSASLSWDPGDATATLVTSPATLSIGGGACLAEFFYKGFGTADITAIVRNGGGDDLSETVTLAAATEWQAVQLPFSCPTSGTVVLGLAALGDAAIGYIDDAYLGRDYRVGATAQEELLVFARRASSDQAVATVDPTTVVFNSEVIDLYGEYSTSTGVFTAKRAGTYIVSTTLRVADYTSEELLGAIAASSNSADECKTYNSTSSTPRVTLASCVVVLDAGDTLEIKSDSVSDASYTVSADTGTFVTIKRAVSGSETVLRGDVSDLSGSLKYAATTGCNWTVSAGTYTSPSADSDCPTPTTRGNMLAPATKIPAGIAPRLIPGSYMVIAQGSFYGDPSTSGTQTCGFQIYDGTTEGAKTISFQGVNLGYGPIPVVTGEFTYSSLQTNKQFEVRAVKTTGNGTNCNISAQANNDFEIRIIPLSQGLPKPFIPGSVFAGRSGVTKVGVGRVNCAAASSVTLDPDGMIDSLTNISSGVCELTLATGFFSAAPTCVLTEFSNTGIMRELKVRSPVSATEVEIQCRESSTTSSASTIQSCTDISAEIICMGNN
jgi:hypothetical protein